MREDIPFDVWLPVFQDVYEDPRLLSDDGGSEFVLSPLHRRLLVHLNLSRVSKRFHGLSKVVFYQKLQLYTYEALHHVATVVKKDAQMARLPRSLGFNFYEYRCSASSPRRPRKMKTWVAQEVPHDADPATRSAALIRQDRLNMSYSQFRNYAPSMTKQSTQWAAWGGYIRAILVACPSISEVRIDATSDQSYRSMPRHSHHYRTLFDAPDLENRSVLDGLIAAGNLRKLRFVNPSPLLDLGPALKRWRFLQDLHVELSPRFPENDKFDKITFLPPSSLENLTLLVDRQTSGWPLSSDLLNCKGLRRVRLGSSNLAVPQNVMALKYLLHTYRNTLETIMLDLRSGSLSADIALIFNTGDIEFPKLERLHISGGMSSMDFWRKIYTPALRELSLRHLDIEDQDMSRCNDESFWEAFFEQLSLKNLRTLRLVEHGSGWEALERVAASRGISTPPCMLGWWSSVAREIEEGGVEETEALPTTFFSTHPLAP
ncbi:uncharacterized protein EI90DRAFT_1342410 [Cantharellus anzutake]|uniref:uncharacterized protein n=1 Tax=Cantharellus anzutake TaxID=1750568 RepID=UPI0019041664|nr:uncharacterized protein EI90DRAFT_1342410 [Cantharellus anzutake]KAF8329772.1 hypothetical protein EI90DRAFT_1342410 [Cantharellus anzutake]